jgi:hypothetical protein
MDPDPVENAPPSIRMMAEAVICERSKAYQGTVRTPKPLRIVEILGLAMELKLFGTIDRD